MLVPSDIISVSEFCRVRQTGRGNSSGIWPKVGSTRLILYGYSSLGLHVYVGEVRAGPCQLQAAPESRGHPRAQPRDQQNPGESKTGLSIRGLSLEYSLLCTHRSIGRGQNLWCLEMAEGCLCPCTISVAPRKPGIKTRAQNLKHKLKAGIGSTRCRRERSHRCIPGEETLTRRHRKGINQKQNKTKQKQ